MTRPYIGANSLRIMKSMYQLYCPLGKLAIYTGLLAAKGAMSPGGFAKSLFAGIALAHWGPDTDQADFKPCAFTEDRRRSQDAHNPAESF
ncbi:hypothetical protein MJO28_016284 [Puccinia striiformis f. sp. tritici]|uniref:Uncharacterized protein n=1 Tax=Puccinia striiformis f. sp. tritici TaxID=168172 RepID=A0ACC0DQ96_9BASI|nr:hypothetical protein MJO28_016284 [Puccinia striiformis f. sp. tritici]